MENNNLLFPLLERERMLLREVCPEDVEPILHMCSDQETVQYDMAPLVNRAQALEIVEAYHGYFVEERRIVWKITLKPGDPLIGTCGFERTSLYDRRAKSVTTWSGNTGTGPDGRSVAGGAGIQLRSARAEPDRYLSAVRNQRMSNLLKKVHFQVEWVLVQHRRFQDRYVDTIFLALLNQDWLNSQLDQAG